MTLLKGDPNGIGGEALTEGEQVQYMANAMLARAAAREYVEKAVSAKIRTGETDKVIKWIGDAIPFARASYIGINTPTGFPPPS